MTGETWSETLARAERARREGRRWIEIGRVWHAALQRGREDA